MSIGTMISMALGSLGLSAGKALRGPLYAQIGISDACNHRCVMCWDHPPDDRRPRDADARFGGQSQALMSLTDFQSVVDDLNTLGTQRLDLVARGEPLINRDATKMVAYAKGKGLYVDMVSNASLLSPAIAEALVDTGLDRLQVSLNAGRPETYPAIHVTEDLADYWKVKNNLHHLINYRRSRGRQTPYVRIGFVISNRNCLELTEMVATAAAVGANEAVFSHVTTHPGTKDLMLDEGHYDRLLASVLVAKSIAAQLGVITNLSSFAATPPPYSVADSPDAGPSVIPCYAGWYTVMILGNGEVMGCCQCTRSLGRVGAGNRFRSLWNSAEYQQFRTAARKLPAPDPFLAGCACGNCSLRARNLSVHNRVHPFSPICSENSAQLFTLGDLFRLRKKDQE